MNRSKDTLQHKNYKSAFYIHRDKIRGIRGMESIQDPKTLEHKRLHSVCFTQRHAYTQKNRTHKLAECVMENWANKFYKCEGKDTNKHPRAHNYTKLAVCTEYIIYIYKHLGTHKDTPNSGTHLAHPGVCMPHLHNHRVCCAAELVGWKGRAWSGQEG